MACRIRRAPTLTSTASRGTNSIVTFTAPPSNAANFTVGRLRIDAGDKVDTGSTFGSFTVNNTAFAGAGELHIDGTFAMPGDGRSLQGNPIVINGIGSLVLGSSTGAPVGGNRHHE
jgi:hypothetical protein